MTTISAEHSSSPAQARLYDGLVYGVVLLVTIVLLLPMMSYWSSQGDFAPHQDYIERMLANDPLVWGEVPNFLFHLPVIAGNALIPSIPLQDWMIITSVLWYVLLTGIYVWLIRGVITDGGSLTARGALVTIVAAIGLLFLAPIILMTPDNLYFGYLHPYVYHNPTMIPLRPTSALLFVAAVRVYQVAPKTFATTSYWKTGISLVLVALLTLACILAKPSFLMTLLPALGILTLVYLVQRRPLNWLLLVGGIGVPAVALLGYQALIFTDGGLEFAPLLTFDLWGYHYNPLSNMLLPLKFVLSIAFPLVVYGLHFAEARRDAMFNLAWLCFAAGAAWAYLFTDSGDRVAGNLVWNGQSAVLILYIAAVLFWLRENRWLNRGEMPASIGTFAFCGLILLLHLVSGIWWFILHLTAAWPDIVYHGW